MLARPCRNALSLASRWSRLNSTIPPTSTSQPNPPTPQAQAQAQKILTEPEQASLIIHGRGVLPAYHHPKTHSIPVALLHFRSYHPPLLDFFTHFTSHAASSLQIPISHPIHLPTQRSLWTVPKSPFVHKKSQENFERKVHKRVIKAWDADDEVIERWVRYLERHAMAGVGLRVVRWQRVPVGIGKKTFESVLGSLRLDHAGVSAEVTSGQKVKALGDKIVEEETAAAVAATVAGDGEATVAPSTIPSP